MDEVAEWLRGLGLGEYTQAFADNRIDRVVLPSLTAEDLKEIGVVAVGHRRKLLEAIAALQAPPAAVVGEPEARGPAARVAPDAERRQLTVMFCDLVGSTALSQRLDAEDMRAVMRAYQNSVAGEIARFDGHVAKFMGDGVLAYFGYPQAHEDDAERALRSGLAIVRAMPGLAAAAGEPLEARIGIATGLVVVGDLVGEGAAQEQAVVGDTPNLAARLETLAAPNSVLASDATRSLTGNIFAWTSLGPRRFKGLREPARVWRLEGERSLESRFEGRSARLTAFVGRNHEFGLLLDRWRRATEGEGQVVLLAGEAGIGKSRILETLHERLAAEACRVLRFQCSPYHTTSALYPVIRHLERAIGFKPGDGDRENAARLERWLAGSPVRTDQALGLVASLLSVPLGDHHPPLDMTPQQQKARTLDLLAQQVFALARLRPVALLFEDAHWADPTTLELLQRLVEQLAATRVLALVTHRPEFEAPWRRYGHVGTLLLGRLSRAQCAEMLHDLTGGRALPEPVLDHIVAKTDGMPLFVEELMKAVLEADLLRAEGDRLELAGPLPSLAIPSTLQDSLMARLDRLALVKEVAQVAAVVGREFSQRLIAAAVELGEAELDRALDKLVASELVFRQGFGPDATYTFKHALVRDVAYESLLKSRRRKLHGLIAEAFVTQSGELAQTQPELLAHHYTAAGQVDPAIAHWRQAGERAARRSAHREAIEHFTNGLRLATTLPAGKERTRRELALQLALGPSLMAVKGQGSSEAREAYGRSLELARQAGETDQHFQALWGSWRSHVMASAHAPALEFAKECLALADSTADAGPRVAARFAMGGALYFMADYAMARRHVEEAIALYDVETHHALRFDYGQDLGASSLAYLGWVLWFLGLPDRARAVGREALELAGRLDHPFTRAQVQMYVAIVHAFARTWAQAGDSAEAAMEISEEHGFPQTFWLCSSISARALVETGAHEPGLRRLEESVAARKSIVSAGRLFELALLAEAYGINGRIADGLATVDEAIAFADGTGEGLYLPEAHRLRGELLMRGTAGDLEEARACVGRAIEIARAQGALSLELRAALSLARLSAGTSSSTPSDTALAAIYDRFAEGFDDPDLREATGFLRAAGAAR